MENEKSSIADMALGYPEKKVGQETMFEGDLNSIPRSEPPYITKKIIKYSFGFITDESQANKVIMIFVGILFCVALIIILRASTPAHKIPDDILKASMERMHSK